MVGRCSSTFDSFRVVLNTERVIVLVLKDDLSQLVGQDVLLLLGSIQSLHDDHIPASVRGHWTSFIWDFEPSITALRQ